jgi:malate dehydrogenase (oxaloacetate-decarboxylating)
VRAITLEGSGKAGTNVAMAPSVSYSITMRLEVASRGRPGLDGSLRWIAENTNRDGYTGSLAGAVRDAATSDPGR